jgi:uncharacterized protein (DUF433 family)
VATARNELQAAAAGESLIDLGRGIYALHELRSYLAYQRPHGPTIGQVTYWINHALTFEGHRPRRPDYTFHDLVSLLVVRDLVAAGVPANTIKQAELHLRNQLGRERPFATTTIFTDGVDVLYEADPLLADQITSANRSGQEVLRPVIEAALLGVRYEDGIAAEWAVETKGADALITLDPKIQFGEPCVAGTRVPTALLYELVRHDQSEAEIANQYRLPIARVRAAIRFESGLAAVG